MTRGEVLGRHVRLFNNGVKSHDFASMTSHFIEDAEMYFEGIPVGPFRGREAIERAYSAQPPDDEIVVLSVKEDPGRDSIVCEYAWSKQPKVRAGELVLTTRGEKIEKLTVRYER